MGRIFIARLAGVAVFDPAGDQIGRVRDIVVGLRAPGQPPRVHGLVVEVQPRRRVFLPITRVTAIQVGAVIFTGQINMRRFEQRASETLAIAELLDLRVAVGTKTVTVLDLAMERLRPPDWVISKVAVVPVETGIGFRRRSRRRQETKIVDWADVTGFGELQADQGTANLLAAFETLRAADLANALRSLPLRRRAQVAAALVDERLADLLEELPEDEQVEILDTLDAERAADVLEAMNPDDAADLLHELPPDRAERLLQLMEPDEADPVRRLLTYPEDTAGGLMTTDPVILTPDATVADALAAVRNPDLTPALAAQVYVSRPPAETPTGRFLGVAHFQRLLREPPSTLVGGVVDRTVDPLRAGIRLPGVASYFATYNLVAAPVIDDDGRLLGAVTVDDVLDHMLPEDWRAEDREGGADGTP
ncbi:magnesium transporter MgtE N-terminal domain-containing protein [Rhizohabitans arisaemae]|uniref:magnesium transporter MgtE N-terminal domain-containing protein n=1 Tax=Rhizohabitans arisaemae TaxID=2720610 RepID=UPI0024B0D247|nr:CBS domain-containing protein [Rhizohabitans arisaemae]